MANQTVTTGTPTSPINYDDASISGLLNGESITINGGAVRIDSDVRWNQQAAVFGSLTLSSTLGGSLVIDGSQVWEIPFSASSGNVPTQGALGTNGVLGGTSGATGELTRVWATGSLEPATAGGAMPATGFIKLRSKTGNFQNGETITLPGGATITASSAGKRSWIHVVARETSALTIPRLANFSTTGDWYNLGTTNGLDNQVIQFPVADECPAIQIETAENSGVYEWWLNGGARWVGHAQVNVPTANGVTETYNQETRPSFSDPVGFLKTATRLRETATTAIHGTQINNGSNSMEAGNWTLRAYIKKETRRYLYVQFGQSVSVNRYGVLLDMDAAAAVVATRTIGSPTGTGHTVTSLGSGWYQVDLTCDITVASGAFSFIGMANSATPTYTTADVPTYTGVTTEGMLYSEMQIIAPSTLQFISSADERGKFFFSNPTTGQITLAQRTGRTVGLKPPANCKIRIPNVICSNAPTIDYAINVQNEGVGRYTFNTTSAGAVTISHATINWRPSCTGAYSINFQNSSLVGFTVSTIASTQTYNNLGIGISRDSTSSGFLQITSSPSGGTITDVRAARNQQNALTLQLSICSNFTVTRFRGENFSAVGRIDAVVSAFGYNIINTTNCVFDDCTVLGGTLNVQSCSNIKINNFKYVSKPVGQTVSSDTGIAINVTTACSDIRIDGVAFVPGLTNVHPYSALINSTTNVSNLDIRNIGSPTSPIDGGSSAQMGYIVLFSATTYNSVIRRLYAQNLRVAAYAFGAGSCQNIRAYNVWGDGDDAFTINSLDVLSQGGRYSNSHTSQLAVYGTHWDDAFTSTTRGRITITANEPLASTANQCTTSLGANAGFTSAGTVIMPNLGDTVTWTMPYYAIGHTSIARFLAGNSNSETWFLSGGTNPQNFEFDYQIDINDNAGFSAWKPMLQLVRQASGGASGGNTITVTAAEWDALATKPVVGDYVVLAGASGGTKLPANTTITNIAGYVLTLSNNFVTSASTNELMIFYKLIRNETISATNGFKLKVRCVTRTANASNAFAFLRIPTDTNSTAQQEQYPLPTTQLSGTVTNILSGSRIQVYNETTATEIANEIVAGTSWTYLYDEGTDFTSGDIIRVRLALFSGTTASKDFEALAVASSGGWALLGNQITDDVYVANGINGNSVTEFTLDYPNVQIDINDPDGTTTIARLYAFWCKERATETGIRDLINGIVAEDTGNYKIITSIIDLKLDNTASTGVIFTDDIRLYRDDGVAPIVTSTTGGGSITLYAGKVYVVSTGGSALTPEESAKLDQIAKDTKTTIALSA